jgi:hypothetical protein
MAKLTLSVDERVIARAKLQARRWGTSVSKMVEAYLTAVADPPSATPGATPILNSVRGILKEADMGDYRRHLAAKYR